MKTSWRRFYRRVASVCLVGAATAWSSAISYAQIASDNASNSVYADGWHGTTTDHVTGAVQTVGDNGGFGFTPWNFDNDFIFPVGGILDVNGPPNTAQSPFNQVGTAWRMGLVFLDQGRDIVRAGRGLATPLAVGQTLSIVIDPPTDMAGFRGYYINLNTGGGCLCYGGDPCTPGTDPRTRLRLQVYNYTEFDNWGRWGVTDVGYTSIFSEDKAPNEHPAFPTGAPGADQGLRFDFKMTGADAFEVKLTPLDDPGRAFVGAGNLDHPGFGPVDFIEFTHWMSESDEAFNTDFYIRSIEVTGPTSSTGDFDNDGDRDGADYLAWQRGFGTQTGATRAQGDANGDGDVDAGDLAIWRQEFGTGGSGPGSGAVPEPSTFATALAAGLLGHSAVRRRTNAPRNA
jgi:hypothetical protein